MDPVYAARRSSGPNLDRKRRFSLYIANHRHTRLQIHHGHCEGLALHRRSRIYRHRHFLHRHAAGYWAVTANRPYVPDGFFAGMEYVGALRDIPSASGAKRFL